MQPVGKGGGDWALGGGELGWMSVESFFIGGIRLKLEDFARKIDTL